MKFPNRINVSWGSELVCGLVQGEMVYRGGQTTIGPEAIN